MHRGGSFSLSRLRGIFLGRVGTGVPFRSLTHDSFASISSLCMWGQAVGPFLSCLPCLRSPGCVGDISLVSTWTRPALSDISRIQSIRVEMWARTAGAPFHVGSIGLASEGKGGRRLVGNRDTDPPLKGLVLGSIGAASRFPTPGPMRWLRDRRYFLIGRWKDRAFAPCPRSPPSDRIPPTDRYLLQPGRLRDTLPPSIGDGLDRTDDPFQPSVSEREARTGSP